MEIKRKEFGQAQRKKNSDTSEEWVTPPNLEADVVIFVLGTQN
jgi:hypothetical protein